MGFLNDLGSIHLPGVDTRQLLASVPKRAVTSRESLHYAVRVKYPSTIRKLRFLHLAPISIHLPLICALFVTSLNIQMHLVRLFTFFHLLFQMAFKYLSWSLFRLLVCYAVYSLIYVEHKGWCSWILSMLYGFLLTFGEFI